MSKGKFNLIVCAHPDDETLFFGGLILSRRTYPWKVICATDGNADGQGTLRKKQFVKACRDLGVKETFWLGLPDIYEKRLDISQIEAKLSDFQKAHEVYTHGIVGEYGHPHHQDVCAAVHNAFKNHIRLYSTAWNCYPSFSVHLKKKQFHKKFKILTEVYGSETQRFLNLIPASSTEAFKKVSHEEVMALYQYFLKGKPPSLRRVKAYKSFWPFLKIHAQKDFPRPF